MPLRKSTALPTLTPIIHALEHEYGNYKQRSEYAFRLTDNKALPKAAIHEAWNGFDHFARAFERALRLAARSSRRIKKRPSGRQKKGADQVLARHIEWGRKHFVAAQFHCIRHAIITRMAIIRSELKDPMTASHSNMRGEARIKKYRADFLKIENKWKSGQGGVEPPSDQGSPTIHQTRAEIKKIKKSNAKLDMALDRLDNIHRGLTKELRGKVPVTR